VFSDTSLLGTDYDEYRMYREKVIDIDLHFEPTEQELAEIAFSASSETNRLLRDFSRILEIKNIRILRLIKKLRKHVLNETPSPRPNFYRYVAECGRG